MSAINVRIVRQKKTGYDLVTNLVMAAGLALLLGWLVMLLAPLTILGENVSYSTSVATVAALRCLFVGTPSYVHWTQEEKP